MQQAGKPVLRRHVDLAEARIALRPIKHVFELDARQDAHCHRAADIDAMYAVGQMLPSELRCTSLGGIAVTPSALSLPVLR